MIMPAGPQHPPILATLWHQLPLLILMNAIVALTGLPSAIVWLGGAPVVAPFVAAICVGPAWAATIGITDRLAADRPVSAALFGGLLVRRWRAGIRHALVPATVCASLVSSNLLMHSAPHSWMWLGCLVVSAVAAVLTAFALPFVFSLGTSVGAAGWQAWRLSLLFAGLRPAVAVSSVLTLGVGIGVLALAGPALVLLVPSLVAMRWSTVMAGFGTERAAR
jgi:hypothetical protein